ncbi:hypothetical protein NJC40_10485 [Pseudomonas sp. 21LCFQ02]|uniref:hypothetical protein n=1 Tax=unclassified Pseudomonas TaxID=196821 RepID=UPI0004F8AB5A|nr:MULTISPECIES: hypothetical protein [unclassified Pseudomonas]MCO8161355.1 hypothetical protein [Pseudomonas sp. 21LCFQ010]MCO8168203.1 hypothetical protein [Pseudomonas sp. 21LCFQ02]MCQ9426435.1 hypothetical protein [Pseudomonas sp. LJDD11]BAP41502.1 hypothetical protein PSCI_0800 [Pseudomonas sp. StFLB209]
MGFFQSLFSVRPALRHYARIDQQGICRALKHCSQAPAGNEWVEVTEQRMAWLGQPLPASARIAPRADRLVARELLAA